MAQIPVRLNTQGMSFPLLSQQAGRTVISAQGDLTYVPGVSTDGEVPQERGIPGIVYCDNVMPSTYGWQSVGYDTVIDALGLGGEKIAVRFAVDYSDSMDTPITTGGYSRMDVLNDAMQAILEKLKVRTTEMMDIQIHFWSALNYTSTTTVRNILTTEDYDTLIALFDNKLPSAGGTDFDQAIDGLADFYTNKTDPDMTEVFILITDGAHNGARTASTIATDLFAAGTDVKSFVYQVFLEDTTHTAPMDNTANDGIPIFTDGDPAKIEHAISNIQVSKEFWEMHMVHGAIIENTEDDEGNPITQPVATSVRTYIARVRTLGTENAELYAIDVSGKYWRRISNTPTFSMWNKITTAHIRGFTYICVAGEGVAVYDPDTNQIHTRDLNAITDSELIGITHSNGYLIAYTTRRVLWSSVVDPEDFEPSDVSGAGGGGVEEAAGIIMHGEPTFLGFIVFTDTNAVSVTYSGNENFPFTFKEIPSAGGVYAASLVGDAPANGYYYALTTNGIQKLAHNQSTTVLPQITDFINGNIYEDYDENLDALYKIVLDDKMQRHLSIVNNRYLCLSYTPGASGSYTHSIVVDMVQGRYGKLKHKHSQLLEFRSLEVGTNLDTHGRMGMLTASGEVVLVNTDLTQNDTHEGVMLFGKLQLLRQRMCQLQTVEVENIVSGLNFALSDLVSYNGKDYDVSIAGIGDSNTGSYSRVFGFGSPVGMNHTLALKGQFDVHSLLVHVNIHGYAGGMS